MNTTSALPLLVLLGAAGLRAEPPAVAAVPVREMTELATSERRWTGIAVMPDGRIFVNYPRWGGPQPFSVGELKDGQVTPFPDQAINTWKPGDPVENHFVCVQSVVAGPQGKLWVLDPANPEFKGVLPGGPKLFQIDPNSGKTLRVYRFPNEVATVSSYLNDVRFLPGKPVAFLTDSGAGALIVLDLESGESRRLLDGDPSVMAEDITLTIGGKPFLQNGQPPKIHSDGIAVDPKGEFVYYQALIGRTLYRVPVAALLDRTLAPAALAAKVERLGESGASDGLEMAPDGTLYLSSLEFNAVRKWTDGKPVVVASSPALSWPDSFALGPDGSLMVTSARIQEGAQPTGPFRIFQIAPPVR